MKKRLTLLLAFFLAFSLVQAQRSLLHCGRMVDVQSGEVQEKMTLFIQGDSISDIQKGYQRPEKGNKVYDLKAYTVMPGLMDMHVHIEHETSPTRYLDKYRLDEADIAFRAAAYARRTLMAGFTTVRDLGGSGVNTSLRDAIAKGLVEGPRIFSCGKAIATTGGHADPTNGSKQSLMGDPGPKEGVINGEDQARKAVRQRYKNGADVIKITATGGVLSVAKDGQGPQFTMEELRGIVETAADYGMLTAAHAHGTEGMERAVRAGIKTIEHGTYMSEEVMALMKEKNAYLVPTLSAGRSVAENARIEGYYPDIVVPKALAIGPQIQSTFARAYQKGVPICFGTDAGVFPHGENGKEFAYMAEAGMPMMEIIQSATLVPARLLGIEEGLGSIEKGKIADIVGVRGNPLQDPSLMEKVGFVMKEGKVYKAE